jgi:hypothetical protein
MDLTLQNLVSARLNSHENPCYILQTVVLDYNTVPGATTAPANGDCQCRQDSSGH